MYTKLSSMKKDMRRFLIALSKSDKPPTLFQKLSIEKSIVAHACKPYIENISEFQTADYMYHFNVSDNAYVNQDGLEFLHETSFSVRILHAIRDLLKGTIGFCLGILSTVIAELIILALTNEESAQRILEQIQRFLP